MKLHTSKLSSVSYSDVLRTVKSWGRFGTLGAAVLITEYQLISVYTLFVDSAKDIMQLLPAKVKSDGENTCYCQSENWTRNQ